jgi:anti-sigma factor RsiW
MATPSQPPEHDPRDLADLSALADGSLDPARRGAAQERIAASPELTSLLARERQVVEVLHAARSETRAPAALRARIEAQRPPRQILARRRLVFTGGVAAALAVAALALALILPAGTPGAPSVSQAAALAALGPSGPVPATDATRPARLRTNVQDVYFPNWAHRLGWQAIGARTDHINGRPAVTVYYRRHGRVIAYTIVGAPGLKAPSAQVRTLKGTELRTLRLNGRLVVTWRRAGHTCVLSGPGVPAVVLQRLAAWKTPGD